MFSLFILWLLICIVAHILLLLLNYWKRLFRKQEQYNREELLAIPNILLQECKHLFFPSMSFLLSACVSFLIGIAIAWILVFLGGTLALDISPAPDMAGDQISNYFFQSFLILLVLHMLEPKLQEMLAESRKKESFLAKLFVNRLHFYLGLGTALAAWNGVLWLLYHEMHFLYYMTNIPLCLSYVLYRLQKEEAFAISPDLNSQIRQNTSQEFDLPEPNFEDPLK